MVSFARNRSEMVDSKSNIPWRSYERSLLWVFSDEVDERIALVRSTQWSNTDQKEKKSYSDKYTSDWSSLCNTFSSRQCI